MPKPVSIACLAVLTITLVASAAAAQVVCTTRDGRVHAGTRVPKDCAVKEKYRALVDPGEVPPDPVSSAAATRRAEIRRDADATARELRDVEASLAAIPEFDPAPYANDPAGWQGYERDLAAHDAAIERLRGRRSELRWRLESLQRELTGMTKSSR